MAVVAAVAAGVAITAGVKAASDAKKAKEEARSEKNRWETELEDLKDARQDIVNPYAGITDLSGLASDLSGQITNPFNNLQVSTAAAEMQAEEADISLANTLETMEATGMAAGGATALAMMALKSKKGIAATIESQEAKNAELRAGGEQAMIAQKTAATTRFQDLTIGQASREQDFAAKGEEYMFAVTEARTNADMARAAGMMDGYAEAEQNAAMAEVQAWGQTAQSVGNIGGAFSDRRLKENIKLIGSSPSGLRIYAFEYINKIFGKGTWQGVMSDEIPQNAVIKHKNGYDRVDYSKIDVEFKKLS
jgi:hypothetical protein|tara:strand:- start:11036 stop:11956 length:921 start_codon:yes stop_codon:yes gene_type:complete